MTTFAAALRRFPLIAILRGVRPDEVVALTTVLVEAGFTIVEVPLNSPEPFESIRLLAERFPDTIVGAGTVTSPADVDRVKLNGGRIILMPHSDGPTVRRAHEIGLSCVPGVATPTEAYAALANGADALKMFPAEQMPPNVVKAWRAILPVGTMLLPVGGITPDSVAPYMAASADGFGLGSALYKPGMGPTELARNAAAFGAALAVIKPPDRAR